MSTTTVMLPVMVCFLIPIICSAAVTAEHQGDSLEALQSSRGNAGCSCTFVGNSTYVPSECPRSCESIMAVDEKTGEVGMTCCRVPKTSKTSRQAGVTKDSERVLVLSTSSNAAFVTDRNDPKLQSTSSVRNSVLGGLSTHACYYTYCRVCSCWYRCYCGSWYSCRLCY